MKISWKAVSRAAVRQAAGLALILPAVVLVGCGGRTGKMVGKVTFNGQPVTGGRLTFVPVPKEGERTPGLPASAEVKPDGSYEVGSGAVVGRLRLSYTPPPADWPPGVEPIPSVPPPQSPFTGAVPQVNEVEVKAGANTIDIELVAPPQ